MWGRRSQTMCWRVAGPPSLQSWPTSQTASPACPASQAARPPASTISKNTWKVTKKTNKTVHEGDKTSKNTWKVTKKNKKTKSGRPSPVGVEEWPSQCPEAIVSQTLFFSICLVTFHGFLLVLSPSCMVLLVFLVTFHVFLLILPKFSNKNMEGDQKPLFSMLCSLGAFLKESLISLRNLWFL